MKKPLALILILLTLPTAPAEAAQMSGPAAAWASSVETHMPGPAGPEITINWGRCPGLNAVWIEGCVIGDQVWLTNHDRRSYLHELGHVTDEHNLTDPERQDLAGLMGDSGAWHDCGTVGQEGYGNCPAEDYADAYAACALHLTLDRRDRHGRLIPGSFASDYGWTPGPKRYRRVCAAIRQTALSPN